MNKKRRASLKTPIMFAGSIKSNIVFDEMSLKSAFVYNRDGDFVEGFEDFGDLGLRYIANHEMK